MSGDTAWEGSDLWVGVRCERDLVCEWKSGMEEVWSLSESLVYKWGCTGERIWCE